MKNIIFLIFSLLIFLSCTKEEAEKLSEKKIIEFKIEQDQNAIVTIDETTKTVQAKVDKKVDLLSVTPIIKVSDKASVTPASGIIQNFSNDKIVSYTVTAEDGSSQIYKVSVSHKDATEKDMLSFSFPDLYKDGKIEGDKIEISVPYGTDLKQIVTKGTLSPFATSFPELGAATDFSNKVTYTVTAEDKTTKQYTLELTVEPQETAVRAVWIPDPSHTTAMRTYQNIINTVNLLDRFNFNTIYVATWVRAMTAYDSQVLLDNTTYATKAEGNVFTPYKATYNTPTMSPTGDPLKDLITEAHKKNIKVIFWFEYGFMANAGRAPTVSNNKIMAKNPEWIGIGSDGEVSNYNNSDFSFNGYNPDVQEFMLKLIEESMDLYPEIDGIQGDDRMPAMPQNSGYDTYTVTKYKAEHGGNEPPLDPKNSAWIEWRLKLLNDFGKRLHSRVKAKKSSALMCFSPNPYPWCEENLMQQWPTWIRDGIVDLLSVQCYRTDVSAYRFTLNQTKGYIEANTSKNIFNPGMILKKGSEIMNEQTLVDELKVNRELGTMGEAYFFVDGLQDAKVQKVLKAFYAGKAKFPQ